MRYLTGVVVLSGLLAIAFGVVLVSVFVTGWAGLWRSRRMLRPGAVQQAFAFGFLGGPAAILVGVLLLRITGPWRPDIGAVDIALAGAGLALVIAGRVMVMVQPQWLEPSWVSRAADETCGRRAVDTSGAAPAREDDEGAAEQFGVSGYDSDHDYEAREPTWTEDGFASEDEAVVAAEHWLATRDDEALVEILQFVSNEEAAVVAVVTPGGMDRVG
jgi:hypothetical protein